MRIGICSAALAAAVFLMTAVAPADAQPGLSDLGRIWNEYNQRPPAGPDTNTRSQAEGRRGEVAREQIGRADAGRRAISGAVSTGANWAAMGINAVRNLRELQNAYNGLTPDDASYDPNFRPPGTPEVPANCEGSDACGDCYRQAHSELNAVRIDLERLRATYMATRNFALRAMAFGDSVSGIHGVSGLAWQAEKTKITQALEELNRTYDQKYAAFLPRMEAALKRISECEERHFNEHDWYNRFGFIYYSFIAERYRRP